MSDVDDLWTNGVSIGEITDTDLQSARNAYSKASDPSGELQQLVATALAHSDVADVSVVCDRALRIELAHAIDSERVPFTRSDYDIAYMIPPEGWVQNQKFPERELVSQQDMDRAIGFSTTPTVKEMAKQAVEVGAYETISEMVVAGLGRMVGQ